MHERPRRPWARSTRARGQRRGGRKGCQDDCCPYSTTQALGRIGLLSYDPQRLSTTGRAVLYGFQRFQWICGLSIAFHAAKTVLVGVLWWTGHGLSELALGLAVLTALQGLIQSVVPMWMLRNARDEEPPPLAGAGPPPGRAGLLRPMLAYCTPLLGARAAFLSGQNLSKVVLGKLFGVADLGYFAFAFQTVERFVEVAHTLPSALMPSLTKPSAPRPRAPPVHPPPPRGRGYAASRRRARAAKIPCPGRRA